MANFTPDFKWLKTRPLCFLGFGFGSGLAPIAPGTFGTLPALPIAFILYLVGVSGWWLAALSMVLFIWGIKICNHTEHELGIQDYGGIVWDEIVAMLLVLAFVPFRWKWWLTAFILFRLFDALKPWPIKWLDARIHGGFGIMLDDAVAALFTILVLKITTWLVIL
ncbi:phosphatidylglycerophosphatase A family protein [Neisseria montereyensis]|uniref:Phosphatidylglycerophosphatase A n=1 Tax=Neisseria montereyensis TaxID=2973938 RepID=A0ABT2FET4_9NEIS|nr:phosphatidylglycerophosphatase A [Neisseria montereyensis]MCS4534703.1 phosphatidylglycerophosphatase A [Neisseria montereyensis]